MRQGLFAVTLVLAAFAGGAVVNGPGLGWLRQRLGGFGSIAAASNAGRDGPDQLSADGVPAGKGPGHRDDSGAAPDRDGRSAEMPALPVADESPFAVGSSDEETSPADLALPGFDAADDDPLPVDAPRGPSIAAHPGASEAPARAVAERSSDGTTPADPDTGPRLASDGPIDDRPEDADPATAGHPRLSDGWSPPAAPATVGRPPAEGRDELIRLVGGSGADGSTAGNEWATIEARMEELGVGRYWVEGDFGVGVRFRCLVPVVGERAVSQHFEAEGDDLAEAAGTALRRIDLWRATEPAPAD